MDSLKKLFLCLLLTLSSRLYADISSHLNIATVDGTTCNAYPYKVIFPNSNCTDNGNGTVSINITGGGSSLPFLSASSTNTLSSADLEFTSTNNGPVLTDSTGCKWRTTIATTGNLITTLVSCPIVTAFVPCVPGVPYGVLLGITCPRP